MFEKIGNLIVSAIKWFFSFSDDNIQMLIWTGLVGALLVFIIEHLRKPKIDIIMDNCRYNFNLPDFNNIGNKDKKCNYKIEIPTKESYNYKLRISYKRSLLNDLLVRYTLNNLKVKVQVTSKDGKINNEFQLKADQNPNVYNERDIPGSLSGINLTKGDSDTFPFINESDEGCMLFNVWSIFLNVDRNFIPYGEYYLKVFVSSDQKFMKKVFKIFINEGTLRILNK